MYSKKYMQNLYKFLMLFLLLPFAAVANEQLEVKQQAESFFKNVKTMQADFEQVDARGNVSGGKFLLKRPGKFRWQYDERQPLLIISNGSNLIYRDKELDETTYLRAENTLAAFLGRDEIRFEGDIVLHEAFADPQFLKLLISMADKTDEGKLAFYFSPDAKGLLGMEVIDPAGYATKIAFKNQVYDEPLSNDLFIYKDPKFHKNVWE